MLKKLRRRVIALIMLIAALSVAAIFILNYAGTRRNLEQQSDEMLESLLDSRAYEKRPGEDSGVQAPYFVVYVDPLQMSVTVEGGTYFTMDKELLLDIVREAYFSGSPSGELESYSLRYRVRDTFGGSRIAFADTSFERAALKSIVFISVLLSAAILAALFLLSLFASKRLLRPIERAWEQQERFVADASHELKTPLTVIMANVELLGREEDLNTEQCARRIENIRAEGGRMRALIESLLAEARSGSGAAAQNFESVDLSDLVSECALTYEPVLFESGRSLEWSAAPGITVKGDSMQLRSVVSTLLDNARKYSYPQTVVRASLALSGRHTAALNVTSIGDGLSREECERVFTRFYRADAARSSDESFGLGLSIAKGVVEAHGGAIKAESDGGETTFTVTLPTE